MFPFCHLNGLSGMNAWGNWGWGGMILGSLLWVVVVAVVILLSIWLLRRLSRTSPASAALNSSAGELVKERYARGEITREEYLRTLDDLK